MKPPRILLLLPLLLVACRKPEGDPPLTKELSGAVTAPLKDLNLLRAKIPPVLNQALRAPYAAPADGTCDGLAAEIQLLDAALGPDLEAPAGPDRDLAERGRAEAEATAVGAVRNATEGLIPFRGWVRKLSGAERASRQVTRAIAAGMVRRAYLKGLGEARGCAAPAAPQRQAQGPAEPAKAPAAS
ncbi:MAG TPA: hypothetical protein VJ463_01110 [Geothrix sp.]|nr:hypothetical protein [Geothrix sp.]